MCIHVYFPFCQNLVFVVFPGYLFNTCANTGRSGPTQYQCDSAYDEPDKKVKVIDSGVFAGVQVWTVKETALYR